MTRSEYLRDLAERLMHVASPHVDQYDVDVLGWLSKEMRDDGFGQKQAPLQPDPEDDMDDLFS